MPHTLTLSDDMWRLVIHALANDAAAKMHFADKVAELGRVSNLREAWRMFRLAGRIAGMVDLPGLAQVMERRAEEVEERAREGGQGTET